MKTPTDISPPPGPVRLVNVVFWGLSGLAIGGLLPTAVVAFNPEWEWLMAALVAAPFTAAMGGSVGTIVGFYDRRK